VDAPAPLNDSPQQQKARERMVRQQLVRRGINNARVLDAMQRVPRHLFVPDEYQGRAYEDSPLPIGAGQTISQPYIVAYMTQLLQPKSSDRVLEIGVGSGYQTAILAELAGEVVGIERIASLAHSAAERLAAQGYDRVTILAGDGTLGYPERAPYNGILVAAAGPRVPPSLVEQLALNGRLIIPVGSNEAQLIKVVETTPDGLEVTDLTPVRFVPLIGEEGWD
jgi:protein-L-isoaspartate(D-aspartate) O-methyltransferase